MSFPERPEKPQKSPPHMDQPVEPIEDSVVSDWLILIAQFALLIAFTMFGISSWPLMPLSIGMLLVSGGILLVALMGLGPSFQVLASPNHKGLRTGGIYKFVRNPMYLGLLVAAAAVCISSHSKSWILFSFLAIVLYTKIRSEEKYLMAEYEGYSQYLAQTKRLIPWVW